jgi:Uma2 family endonuclease
MLRCLDSSPRAMTTLAPKRWTYADYCRIPPDLKRHEIIDGRHFVTPAPGRDHQHISAQLGADLVYRVNRRGLGEVYVAPFDVHLAPGTVVQPDIVVVHRKKRGLIGSAKLTGVPDLLIEILSPSRPNYDRETKRLRYQRAGVREFWIVDPVAHTIEQMVLRNGRYRTVAVATESITLRILRGVTIDLRPVWPQRD